MALLLSPSYFHVHIRHGKMKETNCMLSKDICIVIFASIYVLLFVLLLGYTYPDLFWQKCLSCLLFGFAGRTMFVQGFRTDWINPSANKRHQNAHGILPKKQTILSTLISYISALEYKIYSRENPNKKAFVWDKKVQWVQNFLSRQKFGILSCLMTFSCVFNP